MAVLCRMVERGRVKELTDAELERVAGRIPSLDFLSDAALEALLKQDGFESVLALDALPTSQLRMLIEPSEGTWDRAIEAERERVRRLQGAQPGATA